jgi:hypothetical protein
MWAGRPHSPSYAPIRFNLLAPVSYPFITYPLLASLSAHPGCYLNSISDSDTTLGICATTVLSSSCVVG